MIENEGKRLNQYVSDYVVFDLETTGFQYNMDEIIEIAAIKVVNHKVVQQYQTLVQPENHIPSAATAVNGITDEMVKGASKLEKALKEFLALIEKDILVGHNIHTFDIKFINRATMQLFDRKIQNDYIDTLYMSRQYLTRLSHHKLVDISKYFHINTMGAHRALNDCIMNQKCYEELGKIMQKTNRN